VTGLLAAIRHELLLQRRQPRTFALLFLSALLLGPVGLALGDGWIGATEGAVKRSVEREDLPLSADAEVTSWIRPGDGLRVADGPLATSDPIGPDQILGEARLDGEQLILRRPLRVVRTSQLSARLEKVLERVNDERRAALLDRMELDAAAYRVQPRAEERDATVRDGEAAGRLLPALLVFLLVTAAIYAAVDVITGEKEKGTAETLLASSASRRDLLMAKTWVVWGIATGAGCVWAVSLFVGQATGLLHAPALLGESAVFTPTTTLVLCAAAALLGAQVTAACMALAAWAPGYRQASVAAVPVMLALMAPTALAALPEVELRAVVLALPIGNVAAAIRLWLSVGLSAGDMVAVVVASGVHAIGALGFTAWLMSVSDPLDKGLDAESRRAAGRFGPDALGLFAVAMIGFWFLGLLAQSAHLLGGVAATLAGLGALAVGGTWFLGAPMQPTLSLRAPAPLDAARAVVAGLSVHAVGALVATATDPFLPMPEEIGVAFESFADSPLPLVLVVGALFPALFEELMFRGALLGLMRTSVSAVTAVLFSSAMFGLMHVDPARILITGAMGLVFGALVVRSGSIWTGMIAHGVNNALLFGLMVADVAIWQDPGPFAFVGMLAVAVVALAATAGTGRQNKPS
jgi:sodium transport system permease protein